MQVTPGGTPGGYPEIEYGFKRAIVIGKSDYSKLRDCGDDKMKGYCDLDEVKNDVMVVQSALKKLGFTSQDIQFVEEPEYDDIALAFS